MSPQGNEPSKVYAIEHGTVIDHIPAKKGLAIINVLKLAKDDQIVTAGLNFESGKAGLKDVVKIEKKELSAREANVIAVFAPGATINIIRNFQVAEKFTVTVPDKIKKLIICPNPMCITNNERMDTLFHIQQTSGSVLLFLCGYCEKQFKQHDISDFHF